ncbi:MAG: carboxypeptidase-like regulatory domain-containing protein, partial [Bacteroidales bacterium]
MIKRPLFFLILLFSVQMAFAQKYTLSGVVKDATNGETIMGAYIILQDTSGAMQPEGAVSNKAGFYSISVEKGTYRLKVNFLGYKEIEKNITLYKNQTLNFDLETTAILTEEVVVSGQRADHNVSSVEVGKMGMKIETIKALPALFG